jgi:hypothetical protein
MPAGAIGSVWTAGSWADDCWEAGTWADASAGALPFVGDMNTRVLAYLRDYYTVSEGDLTTLATRYMNELTTGDRNQKWHQLVQDATDAMA